MASEERRRGSTSSHPSELSEWEEEDGNDGPSRTLDSYLKLAEEYFMEIAEKMCSRNFNEEQCEYLIKKLQVVVQSASSFLEITRAGGHQPCSSADTDRHVEIFKYLVALAYQVESFIQRCCSDAWLQAAMTLANVPEYVSSIGFNLELCRVAFCQEYTDAESLSLDQVDGINNDEVGLVGKKASVDLNILIDKVLLEMLSLSNERKDLATYVLRRLRAIKPSSAPGLLTRDMSDRGYFGKLFAKVQQLARLGNSATGGTIDRGMWLGTPVAIKTFYGPEDPTFKKEAEILAELCHQNITSMFCSAMDKRKCSIVMELMDMDLRAFIEQRLNRNSDSPPFTIFEAVDIMHQIIEGVRYLHEKGVEHRDLKSENILVKLVSVKDAETTYHTHVKVADFGLSKLKENSSRYSNYTLSVGTTRWMAPELINTATFGAHKSRKKIPKSPFQSDIYSFAIICYEILTGEVPFYEIGTQSDVKKKVVGGLRPVLPIHCPSNLKTLIERCWSQLPEGRPSSDTICSELKYLKYLLITGHSPAGPPMTVEHPQELLDYGFFDSKNFEFHLAADNKDLFLIKKANTRSNFIEVHILSSESNYRSYSLHTNTPIVPHEHDPTTWTFCLAANRDLYGIKRFDTGTNSTEVHILTKRSRYQVFSLQVPTGLPETDDTWQFMVSNNNDLFIIKKQLTGTTTTEIHALTASSNYRTFCVHSCSGLPETGLEWNFFGLDSENNVYAIKTTDGAPSELYILTKVSQYSAFVKLEVPNIDYNAYAVLLGSQVINLCDLFVISFESRNSSRCMVVQVMSALSNYTELKVEFQSSPSELLDYGFFDSKNFEFHLAADNKDLFLIKKANTRSNFIEVHILSSESNYRSYSLHTNTPIVPHEHDPTTWTFCLAANRDLYGIKRFDTGTKYTEVHILTKRSRYQVFSLQVPTGLHETDDTWQFMVSNNNDLFIIKKQLTGTTTTEIHALTASSNYRTFCVHLGSGLPETGLEWNFFGLDSVNNVYAIKTTDGAPSELYILTKVSQYSAFVKLEVPNIDYNAYAVLLGSQVIDLCDLFVVSFISRNSSRCMVVQVMSANSNYTELKVEYQSSPSEKPLGNEDY
ncbi:hypothetical protein M758_10G030800 [Ceratodon purpureus]|nr:hypothetical protein M758_10G030800 [Ceratodon purpureus]